MLSLTVIFRALQKLELSRKINKILNGRQAATKKIAEIKSIVAVKGKRYKAINQT
ncbi:hypothetical protein VV11_019450 [Trichodesmium erythraeum 21-75]|nr:hypothetical protein [Trichodesmium erythraeum 21-75]